MDTLRWLQHIEEARKGSPEAQRHALTIREGLRMVLRGWEELWGLPRSFETKSEQGRRG